MSNPVLGADRSCEEYFHHPLVHEMPENTYAIITDGDLELMYVTVTVPSKMEDIPLKEIMLIKINSTNLSMMIPISYDIYEEKAESNFSITPEDVKSIYFLLSYVETTVCEGKEITKRILQFQINGKHNKKLQPSAESAG